MEQKDKWQKRVYRRRIKDFISKDEWHKLRIACLKRDRYSCQRCEKKDSRGRGLSAHHIVPRESGGSNDLSNLLTLCHKCHDFVEINKLFTVTDIIGSYEDSPVEKKPIKTSLSDEKYSFKRPQWHRWVYGAGRH